MASVSPSWKPTGVFSPLIASTSASLAADSSPAPQCVPLADPGKTRPSADSMSAEDVTMRMLRGKKVLVVEPCSMVSTAILTCC